MLSLLEAFIRDVPPYSGSLKDVIEEVQNNTLNIVNNTTCNSKNDAL